MAITFREVAHGSADFAAACALRNELLRKPLGMDLFDEDLLAEAGLVHLAGFENDGRLVAYLQFKRGDDGELKMQQVVVDAARHGQGVGRELVRFAEEFVRPAEIVLHAREVVVGFYEALGYVREGERFVEVGIPHFAMRKRLA